MSLKLLRGKPKIEHDQVELGKRSWPAFMQHDAIVEKHWPGLYSHFPDYQFALYDGDKIAGVGNSLALHWEGEMKDLPPAGLDWAMEKAADDYKNKRTPNLMVAVQILINPALQSRGLSYKLLDLMKQTGRKNGIAKLALPVRPTKKHLYPLIPMLDYIGWVNEKSEAFDPWIRVHIKAGGKIISVCPESMTIKGTIAEWQEWTGLHFHSSGQYTVDKALCPVDIDVNNNTGIYVEPNVWIIHSI